MLSRLLMAKSRDFTICIVTMSHIGKLDMRPLDWGLQKETQGLLGIEYYDGR